MRREGTRVLKTAIVSEPIVPGEVLLDFPGTEDGACVLFLGVVRDHHQGKVVSGLDYEVYREMAERVLGTIATEASQQFGTQRITVLHRVGTLRVGDVSTAIAVATPHRREAFEASRYLLEELKRRLPIWKREHYVDGESQWVASGSPAGTGAEVVKEPGERGGEDE